MTVQVKDEKAASGYAEVQEKDMELPFEINGQEDVERLLDKNPQYRDEFLRDPNVFLARLQEAVGNQGDEDPAPKAEKPVKGWKPEAEVIEEEDWLAEESAEPKKEEPTIAPELTAVRQENDAMKAKIQALETQITSVNQALAAKGDKKVEATTPIKLPDLPTLPDDLDILTEEGQAQFKLFLKANNDRHAKLEEILLKQQDELSQKSRDLEEVNRVVRETKTHIDRRVEVDQRTTAEADEFARIDNMVKANTDIFGEVKRSTRDIEDDYLNTVREMMRVAGSKSDLYEAPGSNVLSRDAQAVLALYSGDSDKAKKFRSRCQAEEIGFPADMDALTKAYEIRNIIAVASPKDKEGRTISVLPYETALEIYKGRNISKFRVQDRVESHAARDRALERRRNAPAESKPSSGSADVDTAKMSAQTVLAIAKKEPKSRTKDEKELLAKALRYKGMSEAEIATVV